MKRFLFLSMRRGWLHPWEFRRLARTWANAIKQRDEYDWATPRWVARSARLSFFWSIERVASEQPLVFCLAVFLAPLAVPLGLYRMGGLLAHLFGFKGVL